MDETRKVIRRILGEAVSRRQPTNWKDALQIDPDAYVASLSGMFQVQEIAARLTELVGVFKKRVIAVSNAEYERLWSLAGSYMTGVEGSMGFIYELVKATAEARLLSDVLDQEGVRDAIIQAVATVNRRISDDRRRVIARHSVWTFLRDVDTYRED